MIKERTDRVWEEINRGDVCPSALLVLNPRNVFYLTQFRGEGILLTTFEKNYLITDSRYTEQAKQEAENCNIIIQDSKQKDAQILSLSELLSELKIEELGFESNYLNVRNYLKYQQIRPEIKLFPFVDIIEKIRMIKDRSEIEILKKAGRIADEAFLQAITELSSGISENTLANEISYNMRNKGASKESFDLIVVSGERSVLVHGQPTDKVIREKELIIIDFGCIYDSYNSDCTRTLLLGKPDNKQEQIFNIIKEIQIKILEKIRPGISCSELDQIARTYIQRKGYGDYFLHSLGHGVGLDIHELPYLSQRDEHVLQPGMVVTVEPGIYVPDIGGVRIEDTVVVTEDGYDNLTLLPKELLPSVYNKKVYL